MKRGANLISYPSDRAIPVADALASIRNQVVIVYEYDSNDPTDRWKKYSPSLPAYANDLAEMKPGQGYWVYVSQDVTLTVTSAVPPSSLTKYYTFAGRRVALRTGFAGTGGEVYYLHSDHLGSTVKVTSDSTPYGELRYKAWGETRYTYGTTPTAYKFTGQREEATIGLYFYNAR